MSFTTSDLIIETLESAGVRRVYGLPGDSLNGLTESESNVQTTWRARSGRRSTTAAVHWSRS